MRINSVTVDHNYNKRFFSLVPNGRQFSIKLYVVVSIAIASAKILLYNTMILWRNIENHPKLIYLFTIFTMCLVGNTRVRRSSAHEFRLRDRVTMRILRKHAHAIYCDFFYCKNDNFLLKNLDSFLNFAQNIDCGYTLEPPHRGGSNECPQSMF